jgi:hypothetical protein
MTFIALRGEPTPPQTLQMGHKTHANQVCARSLAIAQQTKATLEQNKLLGMFL